MRGELMQLLQLFETIATIGAKKEESVFTPGQVAAGHLNAAVIAQRKVWNVIIRSGRRTPDSLSPRHLRERHQDRNNEGQATDQNPYFYRPPGV